MTVITVLYNGDNIVGFVAKGHSGYAKHGEDIVCAAVSALTQTAYLGLEKLVKAEMEFHIKDGELRLILSKGLDAEKREKSGNLGFTVTPAAPFGDVEYESDLLFLQLFGKIGTGLQYDDVEPCLPEGGSDPFDSFRAVEFGLFIGGPAGKAVRDIRDKSCFTYA